MSALFEGIEKLDDEIRKKSIELLNMRNKWLEGRGWRISHEKIGFSDSYFYEKFNEIYICEQEAIARELDNV